MQRYTDFIPMGAQTTGVSLIDFNRTTSTMNGLGLVYKIYGDNFAGAIPVTLSGNSPPVISGRRDSRVKTCAHSLTLNVLEKRSRKVRERHRLRN